MHPSDCGKRDVRELLTGAGQMSRSLGRGESWHAFDLPAFCGLGINGARRTGVRPFVTLLALGVLLASSLSAQFAYAQVPGPLEPARPNEEFTPPLKPRALPTPLTSLTREQLAPEQADSFTLTLHSVRIEGAEALSQADFADLWAPHLGKTTTVATLFEIVNAITRRYSDAGYALSFATLPEQRIEDGTVTIRVVEGYVDKVVFTGDPLTNGVADGEGEVASNHLVRRYAAGITTSRPLKTDALERYLLLMNDLPGVTARATFTASQTEQGASTMTVHIVRKAVEGQLSFNNHMVRNLGRERLGGTVALNGQLTGGDAFRIEAWRGVSVDSYAYVSGEYTHVFGDEGLKFGVSAAYSNTRPRDGLLADLEYVGHSVSLGLGADYPLIRTRQKNLFIGAAFEVLNAQSEVFDTQFSEDRTRTLSAHATYDFADRTGAVSLVRLGVTQGLDAFGATRDDDPEKSRTSGSATFTNVELRALRNQPLGGSLSLYLQGRAQVALDNPLLSAAECSFGGREIGRGYDGGALSGDHCLMGSVELRWTQRFNDKLNVRFYSFFDAGQTRQKGALQPGENSRQTAMSWGGGAVFPIDPRVVGSLEVAKPLDAEFAEDDSGTPRIFVSLTARF